MKVDGAVVGAIGQGVLVLLGVGIGDTAEDARILAEKTAYLRIFTDDQDKMNLSVLDVRGEALVVSQFTLFGDARKGRRPSFSTAAPPEEANSLYEEFVELLHGFGIKVARGVFAAHMEVSLVNNGPVTILLDSKKLF